MIWVVAAILGLLVAGSAFFLLRKYHKKPLPTPAVTPKRAQRLVRLERVMRIVEREEM